MYLLKKVVDGISKAGLPTIYEFQSMDGGPAQTLRTDEQSENFEIGKVCTAEQMFDCEVAVLQDDHHELSCAKTEPHIHGMVLATRR